MSVAMNALMSARRQCHQNLTFQEREWLSALEAVQQAKAQVEAREINLAELRRDLDVLDRAIATLDKPS